MSEATGPQPETSPENARKRRRPVLLPIAVAAGAVLCVAALSVAVFLVLRSVVFPRRVVGIPLEITRVSPLGPVPSLPAPVIEVGDTQVALPVPVALEVGGLSFPIQPTDPGEGAWTDPSAYPDSAIWVYGTVVNYVVGVEATPDRQALVEGLRLDDPILLRLSNGARLTFRVVQKDTVRPDDGAIFAQSHPGLTLALLGEGEAERSVVFADFDRAEEPTPQPGGPTAGVGQSVQVGDTQVVVIEGHAEPGGPDLAEGTMLYLVEFSLENTGQSGLDTGAFVMELVDGLGNRYLSSPSAAARGRYGPLGGELASGERVDGTAGYLVREEMAGPMLTWVFGPQPGSPLRARFAIPHSPSSAVPVWPQVQVLQAFLGEGGDVLHVVARVRNAGTSPLTLTATDVSLSSSAGPGELQMAAPPFPWMISGGETREVELSFARPEASVCVVTVVGYTFEISGLP